MPHLRDEHAVVADLLGPDRYVRRAARIPCDVGVGLHDPADSRPATASDRVAAGPASSR